jgi:hypothetical protein
MELLKASPGADKINYNSESPSTYGSACQGPMGA